MMKKLSMLVALASAFAAPAVSAEDTSTQPVQIVRSQTVSYSDIDLGTKKGATELTRRVRSAVENICGNASPANLVGQNRANRCYRENKQRTSTEAAAAIARAKLQSETHVADNR